MLARFVDRAFRDRRDGRIVIGQWPNAALWAFGIAWLVARLADPDGELRWWAQAASWLALAIWAADEVLRGVNPWRRFLGAAVLLWSAIRLLA